MATHILENFIRDTKTMANTFPVVPEVEINSFIAYSQTV